MSLSDPVFFAVLFGFLSLLFGFLLFRSRGKAVQAEIELARIREERTRLAVENERIPELEEKAGRLDDLYQIEKEQRIGLETSLGALKREHEARLEELRGMKKELEDRFESLANGVLQKNAEQFLGLVSERFKKHNEMAAQDIEKRQVAIANLVKPLDEKLGKFDERIKEIETARNKAYGMIHQQVHELKEGQASLDRETRRLVQALRAPKTRGRWGEMQMKRVFEIAGLAENVDFHLEHHVQEGERIRRPDAIVRIPGGKSIVIDVKTPLDAYLTALEEEDGEKQRELLERHAAQVRQHIRTLSSKSYQDAIEETPDFVVMFIPGETFVSAAFDADPKLMEYAFENKILISTPTTLMALIKAIAYGWQQEKMAENAAEVQRIARELYERLKIFGEHLGAVGKSLDRAVKSYNRAVGSMEGRVLPSARKFQDMGVLPAGSEMEMLSGVETETRELTASELVAD